jgi:hypothetical protein
MRENRGVPNTAELFAVDDLPARPVEPGKAGRPRRGRVEKALARALSDAQVNGTKDAAAVMLAHAYARAIDRAEARDNFYAIAQTGPRYQELLESLGLLDEGGPRGAGGDGDDPLDGLGSAEMGDSSDA